MKRIIVIVFENIFTIFIIVGCIYIRSTHGEASILWCLIPAIISFVLGWIRKKSQQKNVDR